VKSALANSPTLHFLDGVRALARPELSKFTANGGAAPKYKFALCARRQNSFATLPKRELLKNKLIPLRARGWVSFGQPSQRKLPAGVPGWEIYFSRSYFFGASPETMISVSHVRAHYSDFSKAIKSFQSSIIVE
jgi:hypothetical protein